MKKGLSLKVLTLSMILAVSLISVVIAYFVTITICKNILLQRAHEISESISRQSLDSMTSLMTKGWTREELKQFFEKLRKNMEKLQFTVDIYRGKVVEELFGKIEGKNIPDSALGVLKTGLTISESENYQTVNIYPIKAKSLCLTCHINANVGDVLGVVQVGHDLKSIVDSVNEKLVKYFLFLLPIPLTMSLLGAYSFSRKLSNATNVLRNSVESINSITDLSELKFDDVDLGLIELNAILKEVSLLSAKLKSVAVDKDMLEFEMSLMEKFIITSEVVTDWKKHVCGLLTEINKVIDSHHIFAIFQIEEYLYSIEVFWRYKPSDNLKSKIEDVIKSQVIIMGNTKMYHTVADDSAEFCCADEESILLKTRSLIYETPRIGSIMGVGLHVDIEKSSSHSLVVDSILTTLVNVLGSVKAIFKYTKELDFYATRDPLTNLYNNRTFWQLLSYEAKRAQSKNYHFSLVVIDFDNFKIVNDRYGHHFGDVFLQTVANEIGNCLSTGDIMARYGGDEFTLILPDNDQKQAYETAGRIRASIEGLSINAPDGTVLKTTISIGIAMFPSHSEDIKDLFKIADNMMYKAKKGGKNNIGIATKDDVIETFKAEKDKTVFLLNVTKNKDNIIPYFQPIMSSQSGDIEINELLMRIKYEDRIMSAYEFVPFAEELGIIHKLDYILIEKVLKKIKEENYEGTIFVNLSPKDLVLDDFARNIRYLSNRYEVDPSKIVFEITERETVKNLILVEDFIKSLKTDGFSFAIDDFGSGYSSFHYVKRFPIDYIKIEGDFIKHMLDDKIDKASVVSIVTLAKKLNIKIVAEFVESEEILTQVRKLGIDYAQGYHIMRPGPELIYKADSSHVMAYDV